MSDRAEPLLSIRGLVIESVSDRGTVSILSGVSFDLYAHEVLGVVGESGSGKSLTVLAIMGLLPAGVRVASGEMLFRGRELQTLSRTEMRSLRGRDIGMIFQDPMTSLNPVLTIGSQIAEAIRLHQPALSRDAVRARVIELLSAVGVSNPDRRVRQYPHEFSGGMRQRAMIAMAMANDPAIIIADEPTTALDVTIQAQVMEVLATARARTGAAMILISHDLGLIAETADRIGVMYGGRILELGDVGQVFAHPGHPYTVGLMESRPRLDIELDALHSIPGQPPGVRERPRGCVFHPRCELYRNRAVCATEQPTLRALPSGQRAACHFTEEVPAWAAGVGGPVRAAAQVTGRAGAPGTARPDEPLLRVVDLHRHFQVARTRGWGAETLRAVNGVSLLVRRRETVGLVGESGCGKSTLGRTIAGLQDATEGAVYFDGANISAMSPRRRMAYRRRMQVVFQDPYASLDPRMTVHEIVAEPLRINGAYSAARVVQMLEFVGLSPDAQALRPVAFSGGQRQRIAIARALALNPELLILDEAVSALDVSIQAQIVNLLGRLQEELGLSYLFISHDLSVIRYVSHRVAVMYLGRIVEMAPSDTLFARPLHPYTQSLLSAVPAPDPARRTRGRRIVLEGDLPNPLQPPSGCVFRTRCFKAQAICESVSPPLEPGETPEHLTACHFPGPPDADVVAGAARRGEGDGASALH